MLRLRVFGGISLDGAGALASSAAQRKPLALLALLADAGSLGVSRDKLLALLWPESDTEHGRNALNQLLHLVRRALDPEIVHGTNTLSLNPAIVASDLSEFKDAVQRADAETVVALYAGPFLDGFYLRNVPEFERWVEGRRSTFARMYATALEQLARRSEEAGDLVAASQRWRKLVEVDALSSQAALGFLKSLARIGDRAGALQFARVYEQLVRSELDAAPSPEVAAFVKQLRVEAREVEPAPVGAQSARRLVMQTRRAGVWSRRAIDASVIAIAALSVALLFGKSIRVAERADSASPAKLDPNRFVVDVFANRTGDTTLNFIGAAAADWVTQGLARTGMVDVAQHSLELWGAARWRIQDLARAARAGTMVVGSYATSGDSIEITAQVVDATSGRVLQTMDPVGGPRTDPMRAVERLRDRLTSIVMARHDPMLMHWVAAAGQPLRFDAYSEYADGMLAFSRQDWLSAIGHFRAAAAEDSSYTLPTIWEAFARDNKGENPDSILNRLLQKRATMVPFDRALLDYEVANIRRDVQAEYVAATQLVQLAPGSEFLYKLAMAANDVGRPHEAIRILRSLNPTRGWLADWPGYWALLGSCEYSTGEYDSALAHYRRAIARNPTNGIDHQIEFELLSALGRTRELDSAVTASLVYASEPTSPGWYSMSAGILYHAALTLQAYDHATEGRRAFERALTFLDTASSIREETPAGRVLRPYDEGMRALSLYYLGRLTEARAEFERLDARLAAGGLDVVQTLNIFPDMPASTLGSLGVIAVRQGDRRELSIVLRRLRRMPLDFGSAAAAQARIAAALGDRQESVRLLEIAVRHGAERNPFIRPDFASLRNYEPFRKLMMPDD